MIVLERRVQYHNVLNSAGVSVWKLKQKTKRTHFLSNICRCVCCVSGLGHWFAQLVMQPLTLAYDLPISSLGPIKESSCTDCLIPL